ncbi:unnamed protein product, partial [Didymodactylos carnosus]
LGTVRYVPNSFQKLTADLYDSDGDDDPAQKIIENNMRSRFQRIADDTKDELQKVLKRVDNALFSYECSVQSSLIQHGMNRSEIINIEHMTDIHELEELLNDSLIKQRYKQKLMAFIVGQAEQTS